MGVTAAEDILRVHRGDQPQFCANVADLTPLAVGVVRSPERKVTCLAFTLTIDKQEGRRLSGIFSSPRGSYRVFAVVSRTGTTFLADVEGYSSGTMLASDRMELCYLEHAREARIASCTELIKQP